MGIVGPLVRRVGSCGLLRDPCGILVGSLWGSCGILVGFLRDFCGVLVGSPADLLTRISC